MTLRLVFAIAVALWGLFSTATTAFSQFNTDIPAFPGSATNAPTTNQPRSTVQPNNGSTVTITEAQVWCTHKIKIAAQADGLIEELLADEGDTVEKSKVLIRIDSRVAEAELAVAERELESAKKSAEETANVDYARAAAALSKQEYTDETEMYKTNASTYAQVRRKQLEAQRAFFAEDAALVEHEKEVLAAEVAAETVRAKKVQLELYKVLAPYEGVITKRLRDQGEWIKAGEPVLELYHLNEMKVEARVETDNVSLLALEGAPCRITILATPEYEVTYDAKIDFVAPEINTGYVRVTCRIQNQKPNGVWLLRDGMVAKMEITLNQ